MTVRPAARAVRTWTAPEPVPPAKQRAFHERLEYCFAGGGGKAEAGTGPDRSPRLLDCTHGNETSVSYEAGAEQPDRIERLLAEAYRRALKTSPEEHRVLADLTQPPVPRRAGTAEATIPVGPGLRVAGPGQGTLLRVLDELFLDLALDLGAVEYAVPGVVSWRTLDRAGYARVSPQHVTACSVVRHDLEALDRFAVAAGPEARAAELEHADVALTPSVCLNLFAALADSTRPEPSVMTARAACARHEAGSESSASRLWSFSMREIVCIGDADTVQRFRDLASARFAELAREMGLPARVCTASDPFFTREAGALIAFQTTRALKHELLAVLAEDGSELAVASANLHHRHFGNAFGILDEGGEPVESACVGFGLDRWAHWVTGYLGTDPADWPELLRSRVPRPVARA